MFWLEHEWENKFLYGMQCARWFIVKDILLYLEWCVFRWINKLPEEGFIIYDISWFRGWLAAVDFSTGEEPWPIFELQKKYNAPGKSPPLSSSVFCGPFLWWQSIQIISNRCSFQRILYRMAYALGGEKCRDWCRFYSCWPTEDPVTEWFCSALCMFLFMFPNYWILFTFIYYINIAFLSPDGSWWNELWILQWCKYWSKWFWVQSWPYFLWLCEQFYTCLLVFKNLDFVDKVSFLQDAPIKESGDLENPKFKGMF